jgi:hypothetical protein
MKNKNAVEQQFENAAKKTLDKVRLDGMRAGACGILGAVLNMCDDGKSVQEIKKFCETSLNLDGMKENK